MNSILQDLRYGLRMLAKNPGFTTVAVITLALGIGANTAIFSVVHAVLLRPLPYQDPDRLVRPAVVFPGFDSSFAAASPIFLAWRERNRVFQEIAAYDGGSRPLSGEGDPEQVSAAFVTANFFSLLGFRPVLGRSFLPEEEHPGSPRVAILGHGLWRRKFGGSPGVLGKAVRIDRESYTVVGVLPSEFQFPGALFVAGDFKPEMYTPAILPTKDDYLDQNVEMFRVIGRLKPGVTLEQAKSDLTVIRRELEAKYPYMAAGPGEPPAQVAVIPLQTELIGKARVTLFVLLGAVGFVMLIACVNVANLLLARSAARQKEIAVRAALGAGRIRLVRQALTESLLLAALGGIAGLAVAAWGVDLIRVLVADRIPHFHDFTIDRWVFAFALAATFLTGIFFGIAPAIAGTKADLDETLKGGGTRTVIGPRHGRLRNLLVVSELALAVVLLAGAGLLARSLVVLMRVDPGFNPHNLLTASLGLSRSKFARVSDTSAFYQQILDRVRALPGVQSAGAGPTTGWRATTDAAVPGQPPPPPISAHVGYAVISPDYFRTMGNPFLGGRDFTAGDREGAPLVAIVNEAFAHRFFPGQDALGRQITASGGGPDGPLTIVGVVRDARHIGLDKETLPELFVPFYQRYWLGMTFVLRTKSDPLGLVTAVRAQVADLDKDQAISQMVTMDQLLSNSLGTRRVNMLLVGTFAAIALVLAAVGIYGVMSYAVAQRTQEIGLRMVLGARRNDLLRLVVGRAAALTIVGLAVGLAAALALTRFLSALLYSVKPTDPVTFAVVSLVLLAVALLAAYIPARRATKVDPMVALRYE